MQRMNDCAVISITTAHYNMKATTKLIGLWAAVWLATGCNESPPPVNYSCVSEMPNVHFQTSWGIDYHVHATLKNDGQYRIFGITGCSLSETDTIFQIYVPYYSSLPDTPCVYDILPPPNSGSLTGFGVLGPTYTTQGEFAIVEISADSLASGIFSLYGKTTQVFVYDYFDPVTGTNTALYTDSFAIYNGIFTDVKME